MAGDRAVLAGSGLPSFNRGVSEFRNTDGTLTVGIDWFSASIDLRAALDELAFQRHRIEVDLRSLRLRRTARLERTPNHANAEVVNLITGERDLGSLNLHGAQLIQHLLVCNIGCIVSGGLAQVVLCEIVDGFHGRVHCGNFRYRIERQVLVHLGRELNLLCYSHDGLETNSQLAVMHLLRLEVQEGIKGGFDTNRVRQSHCSCSDARSHQSLLLLVSDTDLRSSLLKPFSGVLPCAIPNYPRSHSRRPVAEAAEGELFSTFSKPREDQPTQGCTKRCRNDAGNNNITNFDPSSPPMIHVHRNSAPCANDMNLGILA